ncbi:phage tail sheath C-terminal domain-containing protein [Actinoplanes sp. NPDC051861]|uniref:phage tail sheath family protein n=1 Tax=Actinoplanes sp. NPDC051861 TaxID=3155170 RepID=UPI003437671B
MPEYLSPGVYVEEIRTGPVPIEGVGTSTAGFVGQTERGPLAPRLVTSWLEYQRWYGGHISPSVSFLPFAVQGFFDNGGQRLFVARVVGDTAGTATLELATDGEPLVLRATGPGGWGSRVRVLVRDGSAGGFRLTVLYYGPGRLPDGDFVDPLDADQLGNPDRRDPDLLEDFDNLSVDELDPAYVVTTLQGGSQLVEVVLGDDPPGVPEEADWTPLEGGEDGDAADYDTAYIGDTDAAPDDRTGLAALELIDDIALLCVPDEVFSPTGQITEQLVLQCERLKDRFAVLQYRNNITSATELKSSRPRPTKYAAIYFPWIRVFDTRTRDTVLVPPGGHVVGIYARTDTERGVHKAPANEDVRGIITRDLSGNRKPLATAVSKGFQDLLNPSGINALRDFRPDGRGIRVWGARTLAAEADWKYVNVRRLFIFVEESIDEGTQWVVFEPNAEPTWAALTRSITNFLTRVWRDGALAGVTAEEAFFVRCDRTTMTPDEIDNGRLICYIGIAPVKPAEFVIFRISQKTIEFAS